MGGSYGGNTRSGHQDTTTDDEAEEMFQKAPTPSQGPIMVGGILFYFNICVMKVKYYEIIIS